MRTRKVSKPISMFLAVCLFALSFAMGAGANARAQQTRYPETGANVNAQQKRYPETRTYVTTQQRRNPEAGKKKAAKRIGVGTAIGVGGGALIGGGRGALIGGAIGAGAGAWRHFHKKNKYEKRRYQ